MQGGGGMRKERRIVAAAEREMQRYSLLKSIADSLEHAEQPEEKRRKGLGRFITISREAGAGAEEAQAEIRALRGAQGR